MLKNLKIKIFSDGADIESIKLFRANPIIKGFTTNPTLMRKAGVTNYEDFAKEAIQIVGKKPISFEVFTDDVDEMLVQARKIASWGNNVSVKIPVINTKGISTRSIISQLSSEGVVVNVTAIFTDAQIQEVIDAINPQASAIVSIFAGRIADSGRDPVHPIRKAVEYAKPKPGVEILWASTREAFNIIEADQVGCQIITVAPDMISKAQKSFDKNLDEFSRETVKMFYEDARASGFSIA
ncbi:transaldolase [Alphaproteobacteria bacterium]|nr:transaldolase [Alphaproteobacteria bacterium]MDC1121554.1 transaldolase [Alphaproteobacteria bacterium]